MKRMRKILTVLLAFTVILCCLGSAAVFADSNIKPTDVKMMRTSRSLFAGDVIELNAKTYPSDSNDNYLRWSIVGKKGIVKIIGRRNYDDDIKI